MSRNWNDDTRRRPHWISWTVLAAWTATLVWALAVTR